MGAAARFRVDLQTVLGHEVDTTPCHAGSARCAHARSYLCELPSCCRTHLRQMMAEVAASLDSVGVTWWADYGTLLGAVRNPLTTWSDYPWLPQDGREPGPLAPGLIPHDKDADLGVLASEWVRLLAALPRLRRCGYQVITRSIGTSVKIRLSRSNHTNIDVFCWHARPNGSLHRTRYLPGVDDCKGRDFPASWVATRTTVTWEGMTLPAPADPEAFCAFRYGASWRTPIAKNHDGVPR